jgi:hypothetical protein
LTSASPPADTDLNGKSAAEITAYLASFCEPGVTPVVNHADRPRRPTSTAQRYAAPSKRWDNQGPK